MKKISLKKLLKLNNPIIYDIRDIEEYNKYNIPNSINITFNKLFLHHNLYFNNTNKYYIVCELGHRSKRLIKLLKKYNYNLIYVKRGLKDLRKFNL